MTGLLVSVRDADEARAALAGGADLIDVKEPHRGPLGYADPTVWKEIQQAIGGQVPLSAALGELLADPALELAPQTGGLDYAKVGLSGCLLEPLWEQKWQAVLRLLPRTVTPVAVAYADWQAARAPRPEDVVAAAARLGVTLLLVDTYDKSSGRLVDHMSPLELAELCAAARRRGSNVVLAGSLTIDMLLQIISLQPRYVAVRGAVCQSTRSGRVDEQLVADFASALDALVKMPV